MGMHMFSNRVKWTISKEALFVDPAPKREGEQLVCWDGPSPVAEHSPNPSIEEAFMFGYHRALKVLQRGRWIKDIGQAKFQLNLLQQVWNCLEKDFDKRRIATIYGAEKAFNGKHSHLLAKYNNFDKDIAETVDVDIDIFLNKFKTKWGKSNYKELRYITLMNIYNFPLRALRKGLKWIE